MSNWILRDDANGNRREFASRADAEDARDDLRDLRAGETDE
jgi:hypothetical protein